MDMHCYEHGMWTCVSRSMKMEYRLGGVVISCAMTFFFTAKPVQKSISQTKVVAKGDSKAVTKVGVD